MGDRPLIRRAGPEDAERIADLSGQLGYPASAQQIRQRLQTILTNGRHAVYVAQRADGTVIGWIHIYLCPLVEVALQAEIGGLIVDEQQRGQGIGQRLLEAAERWAAERECTAVTVRSNIIRERAHRFYTRLGYRLVKTQRVFTKTL